MRKNKHGPFQIFYMARFWIFSVVMSTLHDKSNVKTMLNYAIDPNLTAHENLYRNAKGVHYSRNWILSLISSCIQGWLVWVMIALFARQCQVIPTFFCKFILSFWDFVPIFKMLQTLGNWNFPQIFKFNTLSSYINWSWGNFTDNVFFYKKASDANSDRLIRIVLWARSY